MYVIFGTIRDAMIVAPIAVGVVIVAYLTLLIPYLLIVAVRIRRERHLISSFVPVSAHPGTDRTLAGELKHENVFATRNPRICPMCGLVSETSVTICRACGETLPPDNGNESSGTSAQQPNSAAAQIGFELLGEFRDSRGAEYLTQHQYYQFQYYLWLSPDREILAVISFLSTDRKGQLLPRSIWCARLITLLSDGQRLNTVDAEHQNEVDPAKMVKLAVFPGVDLPALVQQHQRRIVESVVKPIAFSSDPLADLQVFAIRRVQRLKELHYVRYYDLNETAYSYTLIGAIRRAWGNLGNAKQIGKFLAEACDDVRKR